MVEVIITLLVLGNAIIFSALGLYFLTDKETFRLIFVYTFSVTVLVFGFSLFALVIYWIFNSLKWMLQ